MFSLSSTAHLLSLCKSYCFLETADCILEEIWHFSIDTLDSEAIHPTLVLVDWHYDVKNGKCDLRCQRWKM